MMGAREATPRLGRGRVRDEGMTLLEVVVAMSIMGVFLAIVTTAFVQLYRTANVTETASTAQSQVNVAFLRLDTEIRYAAGISTPGQVRGDWYVEYVTTATGTSTCTELRLAAGRLQWRAWPQASVPGPFTTLASSVTPAPSGDPFTLVKAGASINLQRLGINLAVAARPDAPAEARQLKVMFTALNSATAASPSPTPTGGAPAATPLTPEKCAEVGRAAP